MGGVNERIFIDFIFVLIVRMEFEGFIVYWKIVVKLVVYFFWKIFFKRIICEDGSYRCFRWNFFGSEWNVSLLMRNYNIGEVN